MVLPALRAVPARGARVRGVQPLLVQSRRRGTGDGLLHRRGSGIVLRIRRSVRADAGARWDEDPQYYLDITRKEQKKRLDEREKDPLTQWKVSPIDEVAQKKWNAYTRARDDMLRRTSHAEAPWRIVLADDKKVARLEFLRDLLASFSYSGKSKKLTRPDRGVVFPWSVDSQTNLAI